MSDDTDSKSAPQKGSNFWDSTFALILLVAAILFARFYIAEPFKIPSGSMEPTLFGHEDYGDRIVTNKLAYEAAGHCYAMAAIALALIIVGFFASHSYRRVKTLVIGVLIFAGTVAGFAFAFVDRAVAGEPQRFDVVVFQYDTFWNRSKQEAEAEKHGGVMNGTKSQKINYIKRLVGLPGDRIKVAGGDLWLYDKKDDRYKIVRKWETRGDALQQELWYPVALAWTGDVYKDKDVPPDQKETIEKQREHIAVPWLGAEKGARGVERNARSLTLAGDDVKLEYAHPVKNLYIKQGRWPFKHEGCPAVKDDKGLEAPTGARFRNPEAKTQEITAYVFHTWEGVQCPNCKQVMFPATYNPTAEPTIVPLSRFPNGGGESARFFYGGDKTVGDLRLDIDIDVEKTGVITIEVGNSLHSATWTLGAQSPPTPNETAHAVEGTASLTPGHHSLSLAYVDATVISRLDGVEKHQKVDAAMPGREAETISSLARISFSGVKGTITRLDLYRDLHYTAMIMDHLADAITGNQSSPPFVRGIDDEKRYYCDVPDGHYLMMGDNSPSSSDGRVWGFVPRENLVGRASFIAWPLSRARLIK
jgi:signal peptidase I